MPTLRKQHGMERERRFYARRKVSSLSEVARMTACLRPESGQSSTTASRYSRNLISDSMEWMGRLDATRACQDARSVTSLGPPTPRRMHQWPGCTEALFRTIGTSVLNISVVSRDMLSESEFKTVDGDPNHGCLVSRVP